MIKRIYSRGAYSRKEYVDPEYALKVPSPEQVRAELISKGALKVDTTPPSQGEVFEQALNQVIDCIPELANAEDFSKAA